MHRGKLGMRSAVVALALVGLVGAACGTTTSSGSGSASPATTTPAAQAGYGGEGLYGGGAYGGAGGGATSPPASPAGAVSATVQQGAGGQLVFSPASLTVKKGDAIEVSNVGSIPHTFTITGQAVDVVNSGGQSQDVAIDLAPGTYTFFCSFHVSLGMQGSLTVTG
jgi:plastocyanin